MHTTAHAIPYRHCRPLQLLAFRERIGDEGDPGTASDWKRVHQQLVSLGKARAAHERDVCRWLLAAQRLGVPARIGYANLAELAGRVLGLNGRQTEERLRVGRALGDLRLLDGAIASGELPWSAVRELTRVATPDNEQAWLAWAKGRRVRQIEAAVAARKPGDGPGDRGDPSRIQHRLAFEVRAETLALFRDLQSKVRADLGGDLDDDTLLYEIARRALGGPGDEGRASYQVAVSRCDECGRGRIDAAEPPARGEAVVAMAACDGQALPAGAGERPRTSGQSGSERTLTWGRAARPRPSAGHATGDHSPRQEAMRVPGCSNHRFLDVHHLDPRAEAGATTRSGSLCSVERIIAPAHRRPVHRRHGDRWIRRAPWRRSAYGGPVRVVRLDVARRTWACWSGWGSRPRRRGRSSIRRCVPGRRRMSRRCYGRR